MGIEHLKRWQWAVIGLFIGLAVAWIWSSLQSSGGLRDAVTLGSEQFQRALNAPPLQGHPKIKGITVHENEGRYSVGMKVLEPDPADPHPKNPRHFRYITEWLNPTSPFLPAWRESPTQTVMWRVNPSAVASGPSAGRHSTTALPVWINGAAVQGGFVPGFALKDWKIEVGQWSDPGSGAELSLPLRPATYQMMIVLSRAQEQPVSPDELTVTFNGNVLPPLVAATKASGSTFETSLPRVAFASGDTQLLRFSRKNEPVKIWEVRLIDPNYTIVDYLNYAKLKHPELNVAAAWWDAPRVKYPLCAIIGVVFFGGIWPTIVKLLTGAQGGQSNQETAYDLSRFQGEGAKQNRAEPSLPDGDELSDLEAELRKSLQLQATAAAESKPPLPPAPIQMTSEPVAPAAPPEPDRPANYQGEYYPVVRPILEDDKENKQNV